MRLFVTRRLAIDPIDVVPPSIEVRVFEHDRAPTREELIAGAGGCAAICSLVSDRIDGPLLDALPEIRHVAQGAVGYDNVDVEACRARGVLVTHTPDVLTDATADLAFALLIAVARRLREGERLVRSGKFHGWSPTMLLGMELREKTLGIYGYGRIGQALAVRARAFGMSIVYCARSDKEDPLARRVEIAELLRVSDVISIHAPLTAETRHAFGERELGAMRAHAILINTARGPIVDESALVRALEAGLIGGAGLDVFEQEPAVHAGLIDRDDVVLLPHLGSATREARARMARTALEEAVRVLERKAPRHVIPEMSRASGA